MVSRFHHDRKANRVTGVSYLDQAGKEHFLKAKVVIVSGCVIETPRLLLNSACEGYENGLANSSDTVGRYLILWPRLATSSWVGSTNRSGCTKRRPPTHSLKNFMKRIPNAVLPADSRFRPLAIQALAARTADYLISQGTAIFNSDIRDMTPPPVRPELSPPGTHGPGVPRLG
jgi:choline dehydrogenase-like flavoprotein